MIALCLQIYFARILDVTLSTIRTFYTLKGKTIFSSKKCVLSDFFCIFATKTRNGSN